MNKDNQTDPKNVELDPSFKEDVKDLISTIEISIKAYAEDNNYNIQSFSVILHALCCIIERSLTYQSVRTILNTKEVLNFICDKLIEHKQKSND